MDGKNMYVAEKDFIMKELHKAAVLYCEKRPSEVTEKSARDLVTDVDVNVENTLIRAIRFNFPDDTVISEERFPRVKPGARTWVIDPIDGTGNMAHGSPLFGIQCAFCVDGEPVLSAINLPGLGMKLYAVKGEGAYLNNKKIAAGDEVNPANSTISISDFSHKSVKNAKLQFHAMKKLHPQIAKIRMFGASCVDFAFAAAGYTDGAVMMAKKPWDLLPGVLLCREAGLKVSNLAGEEYKSGDYGVIAVKEALFDTVKAAFAPRRGSED